MPTFEEIMDCCGTNRLYFSKLVELVKKRRIVPFIGAGMSLPIYPTWGKALTNMVKDTQRSAEVTQLLHENQFEEAASIAYDILGKGRFEFLFDNFFSPERLNRTDVPLSKGVKLLPSLFPGVVVTTNFDHVLETVYHRQNMPFTYTCTPRTHHSANGLANSAIRENQHLLFKLHGDVMDKESRVLTMEEYKQVYGELERAKTAERAYVFEEGSYLEMLSSMFANIPLLFLGCSLQSDRTLDLLHLQASKHKILNFAFLEMPELSDDTSKLCFDERNKTLSNQYIMPIWYPNKQHEDSIATLLTKLKEDSENLNPIQLESSEENKTQIDNSTFSKIVDILNCQFEYNFTPQEMKKILDFSFQIDLSNHDHMFFYGNNADDRFALDLAVLKDIGIDFENHEYSIHKKKLLSLLQKEYSPFNIFLDKITKSKQNEPLKHSMLVFDSISEYNTACDMLLIKCIRTCALISRFIDRIKQHINECDMYTLALLFAIAQNKQQRTATGTPHKALVENALAQLRKQKEKSCELLSKLNNLNTIAEQLILNIRQEKKLSDFVVTSSNSLFSSPDDFLSFVNACKETDRCFDLLSKSIPLGFTSSP